MHLWMLHGPRPVPSKCPCLRTQSSALLQSFFRTLHKQLVQLPKPWWIPQCRLPPSPKPLLSGSTGPPETVWEKCSCELCSTTLFRKSWSTSTCRSCGSCESRQTGVTSPSPSSALVCAASAAPSSASRRSIRLSLEEWTNRCHSCWMSPCPAPVR